MGRRATCRRARPTVGVWFLCFHDPFTCFAVLDETASTRRLGGTPFGRSHPPTSALLHCHHSFFCASPENRAMPEIRCASYARLFFNPHRRPGLRLKKIGRPTRLLCFWASMGCAVCKPMPASLPCACDEGIEVARGGAAAAGRQDRPAGRPLSHAVREQPVADVGIRRRDAALSRGERGGGAPVRLLASGIPFHARGGHPPTRGSRGVTPVPAARIRLGEPRRVPSREEERRAGRYRRRRLPRELARTRRAARTHQRHHRAPAHAACAGVLAGAAARPVAAAARSAGARAPAPCARPA